MHQSRCMLGAYNIRVCVKCKLIMYLSVCVNAWIMCSLKVYLKHVLWWWIKVCIINVLNEEVQQSCIHSARTRHLKKGIFPWIRHEFRSKQKVQQSSARTSMNSSWTSFWSKAISESYCEPLERATPIRGHNYSYLCYNYALEFVKK